MRKTQLPSLPEGFRYRLELGRYATPKGLKSSPVHRWFWFPQSFSPQLLDEVLRAYPLPPGGRVLDPFVGAGTTALRAVQLGHAAAGADLSPLSLFVSRTKVGASSLEKSKLGEFLRYVSSYRPAGDLPSLPLRLRRAFTERELSHLLGLRQRIEQLPSPYADFFLLVLLRVQQRVSRAVPDGGWFRWTSKPDQSHEIPSWFVEQAREHIADATLLDAEWPPASLVCEDARSLEGLEGTFDLVLTSPPYPNRHDYSRVFHIELLTLGLDEEGVERLRRESLRSHVEASAPKGVPQGYRPPPLLQDVLSRLPERLDRRVPAMLEGYFEDLYLSLRALWGRLERGGVCAFVIGNARYGGIMVPVDEILVQVAGQVGYSFLEAWVVRFRGNSAQQMRRFGREPARESIVFFRRT